MNAFRRTLWHHHPHVRTGGELTFGERAADRMRNGMGSWPFVIGFVLFMLAWAGTNTVWLANQAFDPYPYILLNLVLSMMAGLQGAILLIAAKRADQISSEVALHTYENTKQLATLLQHVDALTTEVHHHLGCADPNA